MPLTQAFPRHRFQELVAASHFRCHAAGQASAFSVACAAIFNCCRDLMSSWRPGNIERQIADGARVDTNTTYGSSAGGLLRSNQRSSHLILTCSPGF